jgi:hypothetical protein
MAGGTSAGTVRPVRRGLRLFLGLFALALIAVGIWVGVGFLTLTSSQTDRSFALAGDRLVIDAEGTTVRITAGQPGVVEIDRHVRNDAYRKPKPVERLQGGTLVLRDGCPRSGVTIYYEGRYDLRLPPDLDLKIEVNTDPAATRKLLDVLGQPGKRHPLATLPSASRRPPGPWQSRDSSSFVRWPRLGARCQATTLVGSGARFQRQACSALVQTAALPGSWAPFGLV